MVVIYSTMRTSWPFPVRKRNARYARYAIPTNDNAAEPAAGIALPFEDGWGDLIRWATVYETLLRRPREAGAPEATAEALKSVVPDATLANGSGAHDVV